MNRKLFGLAIILAVVIAGIFWSVAGAQSFRTGTSTAVGKDEVVDSTLWAAGRTVDVAGEVNGDLFCAGMTVTVSGTVRGDVICAAQSVTITGTVDGDVRTAGQSVTVGATGITNLTAAAQSFVLEGGSSVRVDLSVASADVLVSGSVGRDAAITGQSVTIGGEVGRNVKATVNQLLLNRNADVGGNLNYTSQSDVDLERGAVVRGETTKTTPTGADGDGGGVPAAGFSFGFGLYLLAAGLLVALVLVLLFPQAIHAVTNQGVRSPWKSFLVGLLAFVVVSGLIILLMLTVLGIPLALILLTAWLLLQALAGVVSAYYLGRIIWRRQRNPIWIMLAGALLLLVLYLIPIIGFIALILAMLLGVGMILLALYQRRVTPRYRI
jgi:cytoskeletal protein CcmA (bactofilin family)